MRVLQIVVLSVRQNSKRPSLRSYSKDHICIMESVIKMGEEKAKATVETGVIAFWPMGSAICVFYGKSQPYSPVNVLGKITGNLDVFKQTKSGTKIRVESI